MLVSMHPRFPCPCCRFPTLPDEPPGTYAVCPVCDWEDDGVQFREPDYAGGANNVSLNVAQQNFAAFGASDESARPRVRAPTADEIAHRASGA